MGSNSSRFTQSNTDTGPGRILPGFEHINRYWDKHRECYAAKILPGEFYVTMHDEMVTTVLGSCISACIRDRVFGVGGMNHFMLPVDRDTTSSVAVHGATPAARYGGFAMEALINEILKAGGRRDNLDVKIFGGGQILNNMTAIGRMNIDFVRHFIETENLTLLAEDVGDVYPRKVQYFPSSGRARVQRLRSLHNNTIVERETHYRDSLGTQPIEGEIDLF